MTLRVRLIEGAAQYLELSSSNGIGRPKGQLSILAETPPREGRLLDAAELQQRAEEARCIAEAMHHPTPKRSMLEIARTYQRLAERAQSRKQT